MKNGPLIPLRNVYKSWSKKEEDLLTKGITEGASLKVCCAALKRTPGGVICRAKHLGLIITRGNTPDDVVYLRTTEGNGVFCTASDVAALRGKCDAMSIEAKYRRIFLSWKRKHEYGSKKS